MNTDALNKIIEERLSSILKLENRIEEKYQDILNGDVSPFFLSLLGIDLTLYTKVGQSLQTTFGMSFYEQVCKILGENNGYEVRLQHKVLGEVNQKVQNYLTQTLDNSNYVPNRLEELKNIKLLITTGKEVAYPDSTVDVFIKKPDGTEIYIDITTVKQNKKGFRSLKRKILTWSAMRWSIDKNAKVEAYFAIPYNPENGEYKRFNNYYDRKDILVGDELWNMVSAGNYDIIKLKKIFESLNHKVQTEVSKLTKKRD